MIAAERPAQAAGIRAREVGHVLGLGHVLTGGRTAPLLHGPAQSVCGAQLCGAQAFWLISKRWLAAFMSCSASSPSRP